MNLVGLCFSSEGYEVYVCLLKKVLYLHSLFVVVGEIVGIVIGVMLLVVAVIVSVFLKREYSKNRWTSLNSFVGRSSGEDGNGL